MNMREEIACLKCGGNEFKLTRTTKGQILAECSKCGCPYLMEGVSIFWSPENEETETEDKTPSTLELGLESHKVPKEIEEKSVEELSNEMVEFVEKESLNDSPFYEISRIFWNKKGIDFSLFPVEVDIALKRLKVEKMARERLPIYRGETSQIKKEKELLDSLKNRLLEKARKNDKKTLTQTDIELYLMEEEEVLPRRLLRMLYQIVNAELKEAA